VGGAGVQLSWQRVPIPNTPSDLAQSDAIQNILTITWKDNSTDEDGFKIYKWGWDGTTWDFNYLTSLNENTTNFTDSSLSCETNYFYQISAFNAYGESDRTDWVMGTTLACAPAQPTGTPTSTPHLPATSTPTSTPPVPPTTMPTSTPTSTPTSMLTPTVSPVPATEGEKHVFIPLVHR
jgi:hypothetical protein